MPKSLLQSQDYSTQQSSIRSISEGKGFQNNEMIIGDQSLGAFLEAENCRAVPSPRKFSPGNILYTKVTVSGFFLIFMQEKKNKFNQSLRN